MSLLHLICQSLVNVKACHLIRDRRITRRFERLKTFNANAIGSSLKTGNTYLFLPFYHQFKVKNRNWVAFLTYNEIFIISIR